MCQSCSTAANNDSDKEVCKPCYGMGSKFNRQSGMAVGGKGGPGAKKSSEDEAGLITFERTVMKRGDDMLKKWKGRHFRITGKLLEYYYLKDNQPHKKAGHINLVNSKVLNEIRNEA